MTLTFLFIHCYNSLVGGVIFFSHYRNDPMNDPVKPDVPAPPPRISEKQLYNQNVKEVVVCCEGAVSYLACWLTGLLACLLTCLLDCFLAWLVSYLFACMVD